MSIHQSVLELVGDTPIVQAQRLDTGPCTLYLKLESQNPGGSIKDRIGLSMIDAAERRGDIRPGDTLVEGTAGNTGIGLALVAQQKGYKLILVVPDKMRSEEHTSELQSLMRPSYAVFCLNKKTNTTHLESLYTPITLAYTHH